MLLFSPKENDLTDNTYRACSLYFLLLGEEKHLCEEQECATAQLVERGPFVLSILAHQRQYDEIVGCRTVGAQSISVRYS